MALPADGLITQSDLVQTGNAISAMMVPPLVVASVGMSLVQMETCPNSTAVIKFRKSGYTTAEGVSEGAVYLPTDANSDITDTSSTATAAKIAVATPISVEALRFGAGAADTVRVSNDQGRAIAAKFDVDLKALIDSVTLTATATSTMDTDTLLTGVYNIDNGNVPPGPRVAWLHNKGLLELKKLVANSGAAIWTSQYNSPLFGAPAPNGFVGNLLGVDIYTSSGFSTTGGDNQQVIFDPRFAWCAAMGGSIETHITWTGVGVASQVAGFSYIVDSHIFYGVALYTDAACSEVRSDS
jgi:hypothetical protein